MSLKLFKLLKLYVHDLKLHVYNLKLFKIFNKLTFKCYKHNTYVYTLYIYIIYKRVHRQILI